MFSEEILNKYDMTIGIECHVQLATNTKLFSGADNDARDKSPNSVVSPIDFGLPGMLPVLNREAVNLAIKAGKALNAEVAKVSRFDRKHYFYPDLPKGYQTTQMYHPIILEGYVEAPLEDGNTVKVRVHHAHMEEDAGKLTHFSDHTLVDLNRAGTPLIEIVSEPDIHSALEAKAYATELYRLMTYAGVTHGDLYHGNMRFDVNLSIAPKGVTELGTRAEVKNLNSFKSVEKAAEYEFKRQVELLEKGERIIQETRGWDDAKQKTTSQRSKEDAQDYRYMPDADIPPIVLSDEEIAEIQATVPKLPSFYRQSWKTLGLDGTVINALIASRQTSELVQRIVEKGGESAARRVALWFLITTSGEQELDSESSETDITVSDEQLIELADMVDKNELSSTAAKDVFFEMMKSGVSARDIAEQKNLLQVSDEGAIASIVDEVLADPSSEKAVADIKAGNDKVIGFLVGQVMKKSEGKANPELAQKLIRDKLS
ncbi:MAG: Asp-tRNA(Asn)/Glu-tRNA(Gln) amidotransferase subunit GatB [Candidatus Saccharibacteria bacterium]